MADARRWTIPAARDRVRAEGAGAVADELLARRAAASMPEAWISRPSPDELRARAREVDELLATGIELPLAGVPFAVKDNIDVAGVPTTAACEEYAYVPAASAVAVQRLLDAGAVFAGKTNLDQFATGLVGTRSPRYGPCRNPLVPEFIAGGSSSGSAIAVAAGEVPFALGTDTAGSGRVPAALCGVVGVKPTPGAVSTCGVVPAMASYDCVSAFTTTGADAATVFDVLTGPTRGTRSAPKRLGVLTDVDWHGDDDARTQFDLAVEHAAALGCSITAVDGRALRAAGSLLYGSALVAERHAAFGAFAIDHPAAMDPAVAEIAHRAGEYTGSEVFTALATLRSLVEETAGMWATVDVLLLPTVARVPTFAEAMSDRFGPSQELGRLTAFANPLGLAAVAVPSGRRASGVPFGVSFVGPGGTDDALLALAAAFAGEHAAPESTSDLATRPCRLAVVGAHLSGQPLNHQLTDLGAVLCERTTTAPEYRLFALDTSPPKPGLLRAPDGGGAAIELEVWALDHAALGAFVAAIPAPLGVGKIALADGSEVTCFLCEPHAVEHAREITAYGGWRAYLAG
jgi:allophanate hydrolase